MITAESGDIFKAKCSTKLFIYNDQYVDNKVLYVSGIKFFTLFNYNWITYGNELFTDCYSLLISSKDICRDCLVSMICNKFEKIQIIHCSIEKGLIKQ